MPNVKSAKFEGTSVTVNTDASPYTTLITLNLEDAASGSLLNFEIDNTGGTTVNHFMVLLQDHPSGEWYSYLSDTDFDATNNSNMRYASPTGPHEVVGGTKAHASIVINAASGARLSASVAAGTTTIVARGNFRSA